MFDVGVEGAGDDALEEFFTPLGGLPLRHRVVEPRTQPEVERQLVGIHQVVEVDIAGVHRLEGVSVEVDEVGLVRPPERRVEVARQERHDITHAVAPAEELPVDQDEFVVVEEHVVEPEVVVGQGPARCAERGEHVADRRKVGLEPGDDLGAELFAVLVDHDRPTRLEHSLQAHVERAVDRRHPVELVDLVPPAAVHPGGRDHSGTCLFEGRPRMMIAGRVAADIFQDEAVRQRLVVAHIEVGLRRADLHLREEVRVGPVLTSVDVEQVADRLES